jgi:hypothetical protein
MTTKKKGGGGLICFITKVTDKALLTKLKVINAPTNEF